MCLPKCPQGIELIAYLERDFPKDVLVRSQSAKHKDLKDLKIATSSLRRRAFWLKRISKCGVYRHPW
ncbi:hypothetical protein [Bergeyella porcorum]|uniref:hypothetical protein n=1 Tax=Bergeyella porcorum TaxID=1735111 RepID=UPI002E1EFA5C